MDLCNINVIKDLLQRHGFKFSKSLGQNFLTAQWVPERIAAESFVDKDSCVLEIGPGIGCLTKELSKVAGKVCAVELDKRLPNVLKESLAECENVSVISGDIMKTDIERLIEEEFSGLTPRVCANLPYNITTPVLTKLIESARFESITVMIQREVARRICAKPGTGDYGAFTVFINYYTKPSLLFDVSPGCFIPQPKVVSTVIRLEKRPAPAIKVSDEKLFFRTVRGAFAQRRKTLINSLASAFSEIPKESLTWAMEEAGLDLKIRGEALSLSDFAILSDKIGGIIHEA